MSTIKIPVKDETYQNGPIKVYKGGVLSLDYYSRYGQFNFLSSESTWSCHIAVKENGKSLFSTNTAPGHDLNGTDIDDALYEIQREIDSHWFSTEKAEQEHLIRFIQKNREKIERGNDLIELADVNQKLEALSERKKRLEDRL